MTVMRNRFTLTKTIAVLLVAWLAVAMTVVPSRLDAAGDPALPGHHPLNQAQTGSVLLSELRCAACHKDVPASSVAEKTAPDLSSVGSRISVDYMKRFLASPLTTHPGTTMPDVLDSVPQDRRELIAEALTHFLTAQSKQNTRMEWTEKADLKKGKELYHSIGCVACHGAKEAPTGLQLPPMLNAEDEEYEDEDPVRAARKGVKPIEISLNHIAAKYSVESLSEFLFEPLSVRSSGRMPDMKLTPQESQAIASYLMGEAPQRFEPLVTDAKLVELGKKYYQALNCAACHAIEGMVSAPLVSSLKDADLSRGCLKKSDETKPIDSKVGFNQVKFGLNENQKAAVLAALREGQVADNDQIAIAKTLTTFRCVACHVRDDYGGVHDSHSPYFAGSELNLGDDGRIPPPLTLTGAKLQPNWMKKVLFDGESVRFYMATRMPQYGEPNLRHLPGLFGRVDKLDGPEMTIPNPETGDDKEREKEKQMRAAGRELLGDKGANCVACHKFNSKAANVNQGIDLLTSYERLQPAYFHRYLRSPGSFRPRTVMPTAWPDGRALYTNILDGDTDRQIEAIWYYLSLGTSAADPSGVRGENTKLQVGDRANIHRGRSRVAGFRGIAVGLPEKLSYAFNAETGSLTAIWSGDFVHVNWSGQGSGDFNPASEAIPLPQDVSFVELEEENSPWPLLPVMTKDAPVNPNPLYPKNVGYQFRGYFLDELLVPTFLYRTGAVEIEDRSVAKSEGDILRLSRSMKFSSPAAKTIWFRALIGEINQESDKVFTNGRVRLTIPVADTKIRTFGEESKQSELLLRLSIPQGESTLEFIYEPLKK